MPAILRRVYLSVMYASLEDTLPDEVLAELRWLKKSLNKRYR